MARSPFTLAASVSSALPGAAVVGAAELTERTDGRYDSALVTLEDGRRVVVRVPVDTDADLELVADTRALRALTPGVRRLLPFDAPTVLGTARMDGFTAVVQEYVAGYRVEAGHIPAGRGAAWSLGSAIAKVHALPHAVARDAGLRTRTSAEVRHDAERLLDRAEATGALPFGLLRRWSTALGADRLWRFEATVTLGGVDPGRFVLSDTAAGPTVTGLLAWHGLGVGDPAEDLRWLASAPDARDDVLEAYAKTAHHTPDAALAARSRLYAELEFARWLAHGHETGAARVVEDAVALLTALDDGVRDEPLLPDDYTTVDDALELLGRTPAAVAAGDTSMQTDTYDPALLAAYLADRDTAEQADIETVPIDLSDWTPDGASSDRRSDTGSMPMLRNEAASGDQRDAGDDGAGDEEHAEAARNALRRWSGAE
ncbi:aminoglycoside phosphotransferase [Microbacterium sp. cf332]|uniref:aminoglycoside phosphotransferase n=1 Tax=Microbacterium sp. cf332 TaxID=1761804 RepID=UPI00088090DD|nr:aminoglycoside phosphotransferase [Microbacterium sp. cf332]SDQ07111.1 Predicted kinase, aminoglycoside phosphotransferase (APT) family [Microbacterium sp. cf332]